MIGASAITDRSPRRHYPGEQVAETSSDMLSFLKEKFLRREEEIAVSELKPPLVESGTIDEIMTLRTASTSNIDVVRLRAENEIRSLFGLYREGSQDGLEDGFIDELRAVIRQYGSKAIYSIAEVIFDSKVDPEFVGEVLRWLGTSKYKNLQGARRSLLEKSLTHPSRWIRYNAALGLVSMRDPHAIPYLRQAVAQEGIKDLRTDLVAILSRLERIRDASIPSNAR